MPVLEPTFNLRLNPGIDMNTYTIVLERISTGEKSPSMLTRQETEQAAREYAEKAIAGQTDLRVAEIVAR